MNLSDAELQQTTGFPIASGTLSIGSEAFGDPEHRRVLLKGGSQEGFAIWPVTDLTRDEHGFCDVRLGEFGLAISRLSLLDVANLSPPWAGRQSFARTGTGAGTLFRREPMGPGWTEKAHAPIDAYQLSSEYISEGLRIEISGQWATAGNEREDEFAICATIPWATLALCDFPYSYTYWKFGHQGALRSKFDSATRPREPRKLGDLLISQGSACPLIKGQISFDPEVSWPSPSPAPSDKFVSIQYGSSDEIYLSEARQVVVLDNGFAGSGGSNRFLTIAALGRPRIEREFLNCDALSMRLAGDALGSIRYQTGYAYEAADPLGWISQKIRTMSLVLVLGTSGLEISANGELDDFDPVMFGVHKKKRNSQLKPIRTYTANAVLPWALLAARGFSFARRVKDF